MFTDTKKTNNDQENTSQKTKDWSTRTPQKQEVNGGAPEGLLVPAPQKPGMNGGVFNFLYNKQLICKCYL
jgi:hypothetical protein